MFEIDGIKIHDLIFEFPEGELVIVGIGFGSGDLLFEFGLELSEGKLSRSVLRGPGAGNSPQLLDVNF